MNHEKLVYHARQELRLIKNVDQVEVECMTEMVGIFAGYKLSEESGAVVAETLPNLLQFRTLSALTDNPEEWAKLTNDLWQNRRNDKAFSNDGGKSFFLMPNNAQMILTHPSAKESANG